MQINLSFDSLAELQEFASWAAQRGQYTETRAGDLVHIVDTRPVTAEGAVIPDDTGHPPEPASADASAAPSTDPAPEDKPKRKRRTKAEIAADEAAVKAAQQAADVAELRAGVEQGLKAALMGGELVSREDSDKAFAPLAKIAAEKLAAAVTASASPEIVALAATIDGSDKMAHMNEGRDFIAKHGFPKYNETFALADVPANIAAHTPEQAALHRAAMQWLIAQGGAK